MFVVQDMLSLCYLRNGADASTEIHRMTPDREQAQVFIDSTAAQAAANRLESTNDLDEDRFIVRPFQPFAALYA